MFSGSKFRFRLLVLLMAIMLIVMNGCAAKRKIVQDPESGLVLKYQMQEKKALKYLFSSEFDQSLNVMGQSVDVRGDETRAFSIESKGQNNNQYDLAVTIDSMSVSITSPQGEIVPDMSSVTGKDFNFTLSALGKESDLPDGVLLEYELAPGEKASAISGFQAMFPDLPSRRVKIGDTWLSSDTIDEKTSRGEVLMYLRSNNRLDAIETINGMKCAKIVSEVSGTLDGKGQEQGMDLISKADITGTDIWYFAFDKGIFIKSISKGSAEGTIKATGPQEMTIPMTREYRIEVALIK